MRRGGCPLRPGGCRYAVDEEYDNACTSHPRLRLGIGLRAGVHGQRGASRSMCGGKAVSSGKARSVRP